MTAAGVVEFDLAFALGWAPLARAAALVVYGMFVSAIFEFAKIDAIGTHANYRHFARGVRRRRSMRAAEPGDRARLVRRRNCRLYRCILHCFSASPQCDGL